MAARARRSMAWPSCVAGAGGASARRSSPSRAASWRSPPIPSGAPRGDVDLLRGRECRGEVGRIARGDRGRREERDGDDEPARHGEHAAGAGELVVKKRLPGLNSSLPLKVMQYRFLPVVRTTSTGLGLLASECVSPDPVPIAFSRRGLPFLRPTILIGPFACVGSV